jgi:subtilase family serine protease
MRIPSMKVPTGLFMRRLRIGAWSTALSVLAVTLLTGAVAAQSAAAAGASERLITQNVDERNQVSLGGTLRPEMTAANDRGAVSDSLVLEHIYLQLSRSATKSAAADALVDELHDPRSAVFHKWLTADEVATRFGPDAEDAAAVSSWLGSHGFTLHTVYAANGVIDFSGTAGAIREAFHTEIHKLVVKGQAHIANASVPSVPAALAPAIAGFVGLHDFMPHTALKQRSNYTVNSSYQLLVPGDLETIYNMNPVYARGASGQGQSIVVLEDTDLYSTQDWRTFRQTFGLDHKFGPASLTQIHPQPSNNPNNGGACADPGVNGDDDEAAVDVEWASAAAPSANIVLASCADTDANFGGFIALQNLLTARGRPPAIISLSYGNSESELGTAGNQYIYQLYQLAAFQGVSLFVSAGDSGADTTDQNQEFAVAGINVSGFASTPYNVAVGGTDFGDAFLGENSSYWNATNKPDYASALSYIPEIPWNDSCASQLITAALGFEVPYGPSGTCNNTGTDFLEVVGGSGGPSGCAYGNSPITGVVLPPCQGYRKPLFQYGMVGNPRDGVRDVPDVSLFAGNGIWGHYYVICYSDPTPGAYGAPCTGAPDTWSGGGGTSFAAPIMAGIQALVNQAAGSYQGNPDYVYYALADEEYGFRGNGSCNSTLGNQVDANCVFYDVTLGDNDMNCQTAYYSDGTLAGTFNCFLDGSLNGVLSTSNNAYKPAYVTTTGYDFPSGIGTVNAYNLVRHWPGSRLGGNQWGGY